VLCGGNIDIRLLAAIMVRELERDGRIVSLRLTSADRPGLLGKVAGLLGEQGANILDVSHCRRFLDVPAKGVSIDVTFETRGATHVQEIEALLARNGFTLRRVLPQDLAPSISA
jgi:threonine dehydratase